MNWWMELILRPYYIVFLTLTIYFMPIQNLTQEELNGLSLSIENGAVISASITTTSSIPDEINMVCFGDSNTYGIQLQESEKFCTILWSQPNIVSFNEWVSGNTSSQLLSRLQTSVLDRKDATKRNIMTLMIWTNDFWVWLTVQDVWSNIQNIMWQVQAQWWEVILMTYPVSDAIQNNPKIRELNTLIMANEAELDYTAIDIHSLFVDPTDADRNIDEIARTQLHFNGNGHRVIADTILTILWYDVYMPIQAAQTEIDAQLATWGYTGASFFAIEAWKGILIGKNNSMFKLWIIQYAVSGWGWAFGGNTSLSSKITNYWKFDSDATDSVPTTWVDGTVTWATSVTWKINNGYSFDGTNDYIDYTDSDFDTAGDFSVWGWVKFDTFASTGDTRFISKRIAWADWWMILVNTSWKLRVDFYANSWTYYTNSSPSTTFSTWTWYHVGFSYNNTTKLLQCYINGSADGSVTTAWTPTLNNEKLQIGRAFNSFFEWDLDEFFFANGSVLTASDWSDLYNGWAGLSY